MRGGWVRSQERSGERWDGRKGVNERREEGRDSTIATCAADGFFYIVACAKLPVTHSCCHAAGCLPAGAWVDNASDGHTPQSGPGHT
jgi:hypothetical protein